MFAIFKTLLAAGLILLSDRADFWNPDQESNQTAEFDFTRFKGKRVLLLVHGYNNTAEETLATYSQVNQRIAPLYDAVIGYLWPGCDNIWEYFSAEKNADELTLRMRSHLSTLSFFSGTLDVLAHSMGNRLVLSALDYLSDRAPKKTIQNFYSLAAAVDDESIEKRQKYYYSTQHCENMYVFHSGRDEVLKIFYLLAERDSALGSKGVEDLKLTPKNIQFIDCTALVGGHSEYFSAPALYKFIQNQHEHQTPSSYIAPNVRLLADGFLVSNSFSTN